MTPVKSTMSAPHPSPRHKSPAACQATAKPRAIARTAGAKTSDAATAAHLVLGDLSRSGAQAARGVLFTLEPFVGRQGGLLRRPPRAGSWRCESGSESPQPGRPQ